MRLERVEPSPDRTRQHYTCPWMSEMFNFQSRLMMKPKLCHVSRMGLLLDPISTVLMIGSAERYKDGSGTGIGQGD